MQENQAAPGGQASRGSKESPGPLASGQASKVLKETKGTLGPLEALEKWATQDPPAPWAPLAPQG